MNEFPCYTWIWGTLKNPSISQKKKNQTGRNDKLWFSKILILLIPILYFSLESIQISKCEKWNTRYMGNTSSHVLTAVFLWLFATMIIMMIICGSQFVTRQLFSDHCAKPPRNPYFRKTEFLTWKNPQWKTLPLRKVVVKGRRVV